MSEGQDLPGEIYTPYSQWQKKACTHYILSYTTCTREIQRLPHLSFADFHPVVPLSHQKLHPASFVTQKSAPSCKKLCRGAAQPETLTSKGRGNQENPIGQGSNPDATAALPTAEGPHGYRLPCLPTSLPSPSARHTATCTRGGLMWWLRVHQ